ncbi:unnamed protein product [Protopolystoma xenopodis]|uniref:Uncharacterized protein n=1 Tax=Protopolystoma xenopodis TaxID=117903 RepID=A0A448WEX6_9PLAT|nr:unnamed protein product [Protopolystoma xenopodis]
MFTVFQKPIRPPPPDRRFVRCTCDRLIMVSVDMTDLICPRCHLLLVLPAGHLHTTVISNRPRSAPVRGECDFLWSSSNHSQNSKSEMPFDAEEKATVDKLSGHSHYNVADWLARMKSLRLAKERSSINHFWSPPDRVRSFSDKAPAGGKWVNWNTKRSEDL